jgi:hypothetical protein
MEDVLAEGQEVGIRRVGMVRGGWDGGSYSEVKSSDLPRRGDHA